MAKNRIIALIVGIIVIVALGAAWIFRDPLNDVFGKFSQSLHLENIQNNNFNSVVDQIKKDVFTPNPLSIGGKENTSVLTRAKVIAETNVQRYDNGTLLPLIENAQLDAAAAVKAKDMFDHQYFEHISPDGTGPGQLVKNAGYEYIVAGENLILGNFASEKEVVQLWMNSPGHRANILNSRFKEIGVAIVKGTYKGQSVWIGVQEFGLSLSACAQPDANVRAQIDLNQKQLDQLLNQIEAKKAQVDQANQQSNEYNQLVKEYNALVKQYNALGQETKNLIAEYNSQVNQFNQCVAGT